jgi:hypothetical protein
MPFSFMIYCPTLKMPAVCSSEMSVEIRQISWRYIPEHETRPACCNHGLNTLLICTAM